MATNHGLHGRASLRADEVEQSTESEAESSYQGWSDQWRGSSDARPSLSSGDDDMAGRPGISFQHISQRRSTITRPGLHTAGSNLVLDSVGPSHAILNVDTTPSPAAATSSSFGQPPPYPDSAYSGAYPRARRKSVTVATAIVDSDDPDGKQITAKGKKKKMRAASFSLPFHRRRRASNAGYLAHVKWWAFSKGRKRWTFLTALLFALVTLVVLWRRAYELQVEFSWFSHRWVKEEFDVIMPLRGCFDPARISPLYDLDKHLKPKHQSLSPGVSLKRGTACYDFSSTVQPIPGVEPEQLLYHTYWRSDLIPFGERHLATLESFLATQPLSHSKLILWTNGVDTIGNSTFVKPIVEKWGDYIEVRQVDMTVLTKGTELDGLLNNKDGGGLFDARAWVDGDAVRLLVLWHYGGVWMDMDQVLTRDLHPLVEHEFVTQWDCYDKPYFSLNGALMHFRQHSPYLCEAFHIMATSPLPKPNTFTWGSHLYSKLHRRLLAGRVRPFTVLPWCFADPRNCRSDIRFPDPFGPDPEFWGGRHWEGQGEVGRSGKELLEEKVGYVWTVHLHNQWKKEFPKGGWVDRLIEGYRNQIGVMERYMKARKLEAEQNAREEQEGWEKARAAYAARDEVEEEVEGVDGQN